MLVLGEGFSKQSGPWLQWVERMLETTQPGAVQKAREGAPVKVRGRGFSVQVVPVSKWNLPEQLAFPAEAIVAGEPDMTPLRLPRPAAAMEMTPSDLAALNGCFRFFQWTRLMGLAEPGMESNGEPPQMRLGTLAHSLLESGVAPDPETLATAGLSDLAGLFESAEWRRLCSSGAEREMPFIVHVSLQGGGCWVRGRMDAAVPGPVPRVIDYKYARWREGGEANYDIQMTAYCLALMKACETDRAEGELWYLKPPMKIVRREYSRREAERSLKDLIERYVRAIETDCWPPAERAYCDRVECGFREKCWR
jgi:CRISPR/Cas system-associated exonuclease Cas4 (RecB family)